MAPFTKRPTQGAQQLVRCWVEVAGSYDGEEHPAGSFTYLDERHAWQLQRKGRVRICSPVEAQVTRAHDDLIAARNGAMPRISLGMDL